MARQKTPTNHEEAAEINLTPMLDVVFIMLIFFIVMASFLQIKSLTVNIPSKSNSTSIVDNSAIIQINAQNEIYIDGRRVEASAVRALVAQKYAENENLAIIIQADKHSTTQTYVSVADAARQAKVSNISLLAMK